MVLVNKGWTKKKHGRRETEKQKAHSVYMWQEECVYSIYKLLTAMAESSLYQLSIDEPTYWPSDQNKTPGLLDFCIVKGISRNYLDLKPCWNLPSNNSPIFVSISIQVILKPNHAMLMNKFTDCIAFCQEVIDTLDLDS